MGGVEGPPISSGFLSGADVRTQAGGPANYANHANSRVSVRVIRVIRWPFLLAYIDPAPLENPQDARGPSTPPMLPRSAQDDRLGKTPAAAFFCVKGLGARKFNQSLAEIHGPHPACSKIAPATMTSAAIHRRTVIYSPRKLMASAVPKSTLVSRKAASRAVAP